MPTLAEPVMAAHSSLKSLKKVSHSEHNIIIITNHQGGRPGGGGGGHQQMYRDTYMYTSKKVLKGVGWVVLGWNRP